MTFCSATKESVLNVSPKKRTNLKNKNASHIRESFYFNMYSKHHV